MDDPLYSSLSAVNESMLPSIARKHTAVLSQPPSLTTTDPLSTVLVQSRAAIYQQITAQRERNSEEHHHLGPRHYHQCQ